MKLTSFEHPEEAESYGLDWKDPLWKLDGEDFSVVIRLGGPYIDNRWHCYFRNPGVGQPFATREIRPL
jgi:hypothetical protein